MIANTDKTVLGTPLSSGEAAGGATSGALVVVDTSVQDYQTLLEGLPSGAEILLIDGAGNGFTQLADMLAGRAGVEAIHILSHGNAGMVKLGTDILSLDTLDAHAEALAALSAALAPGGDLLLYGCNTGAGSDGQAFIDRLAELTGADVAASDDLTGAAALGGDWELERNTGDMTASSLMPGDYAHTLETITILDGSEDGTLNDPDGTFVKTVDGKNITFTAGSSDSGGDTPAFFNNAGYMIGYDDIINETKTTISLEAGHSFDLTAFDYYTDYDDTITLDITLADDSTVSGTLAATTGSAQTISDFTVFSGLSSTSLNDIKSVMISTTNSGSNAGFGINNFVVSDVKAIVSNTQPALGGTPDDATINEDTATAIDLSAYNVSDAEDDTITLTLAVDAGTIAATDGNGTTAGVTISSSGSGSMTLQGSAANLNTYLNDTSKIVYTPASNATASATLTITPNDGTIDGTADTVTINITAVNDAPTVTSGEGSGFAENGTGPAYTVTATDPENDTLTFAISGGADAALFDIDASTGAVTFKTPPDYENPADSGGDNSYYIEVTASDGKATSPAKLVAIPVTDVTVATPVFTSGTTAIFAENGTDTVYTATASVSEGVGTPTFSITGGADQALFDIDGSTGAVTFKSAPDFESAKDAGSNNVYDVTVTATVGAQTVDQAITITVTNVNEAPEVTNKTTTATVAENGTGTVYTVTGSDPDAGDTPTFTISGGADANLFSIDKSTGAVTFKTAPDFENPSDNGKNNVYDIEVTASDGTLTSSSKAVAITVTDANDAPTLATNKGASVQTSQTVTITTAMLNEGDQDDDGADLTYALLYGDPTGGDLLLAGVTLAEGDSFTQQDIDDGKLTFKAGSGAGSFGFDFYLRDNDNASLANQEFTITVTTPAPETPTPTTPPVVVTPTTPTTPGSGENTQAETITNNGSTPGSAPIVQNSNNNGNVVTATLPGNTSLTSEGPSQAQTKTDALTSLVTSIEARGSTSQTALVGGAQTFLTNLAETSTLDVRTIVPTSTGTTVPGTPIIISGTTDAGQSEAFVIDMRSMPSGSSLQLENIEFASIIGSTTITGGAGQNYVVADDASQYIVLGADDDYIDGGAGNDTVGSADGNDTLLGGDGNDSVFGGEGNDSLDGGTGFDTLDLTGGGSNVAQGGMNADTVMGGAGNDELRGGKGHDSITGGAGNDVLYSGFGNDTLTGGDGADVFILRAYDAAFADAILTATVTDFQQGTDHLAVENATLAELQAAIASQTVTDTGVVIEVAGATLTFLGISQLTAADIDTAFYG